MLNKQNAHQPKQKTKTSFPLTLIYGANQPPHNARRHNKQRRQVAHPLHATLTPVYIMRARKIVLSQFNTRAYPPRNSEGHLAWSLESREAGGDDDDDETTNQDQSRRMLSS